MMKRILLAAAAWLVLGLVPVGALDLIQVDGNRFVDTNGKAIVFRGMNTSDPDKLERQGQWNERYFSEIATWGANIVRLPVHPRAWRARGPDVYLKLLDQGIEWAGKNGLHVIIDWHSIGNLKEERFQNDGYITSLAETSAFWAAIAERYKGNATVAFYELYNEPTVSGDDFGKMTWPEWKEIQERLIAHIRRIDPETIILVAGFDWAYDLTWVGDDPFTEANIAYVSHPYPQKRDEPWEEKWEADWGYVSDKYPVILTEVGFCLEEEKGAHVPVISTEKYGIDLTSYTERKGISWVAWVFDVNWSPQLITDWDFTPSTQGRFFKGYLQSKRKQ